MNKVGPDETGVALPDVLGSNLRLLFVGFNPSPSSAANGHHYAGPGNQFWRLLAASGLTPRRLDPAEDGLLPQWGIGLTNLAPRPTRSAAELSRAELRYGLPRLETLVEAQRPAVVAYTGKGVYLAAAGRGRAPWGLQGSSLFAGAQDFVLPSPSGLVRMSFDERLEHYRALRRLLIGAASDSY